MVSCRAVLFKTADTISTVIRRRRRTRRLAKMRAVPPVKEPMADVRQA
jgi:hypothetical protein